MNPKSIEGKIQADGPQTFTMNVKKGEHVKFGNHQLRIVLPVSPAAGTMKVEGKPSVASDAKNDPGLEDLSNSNLDLTSGDLFVKWTGYYSEIVLTTTALDAGKTYDAHLTSSE